MKKRILCLVLAVLTVLSVIPAIAISAFADSESGTIQYRTDKTYEGYKDLYHTDGLVAFVDMTRINADNTGTTDSYDENDKFITGNVTLPNNEGKHYYIRIMDGALAGKYFMLVNDAGTIEVDAGGNIIFPTNESDSIKNNGIYFGAYFTDENGEKKISQSHQVAGTGGNFGIENEFYYPKDSALGDGSYGNFTIQASGYADPATLVPNAFTETSNQRYRLSFISNLFGTQTVLSIKYNVEDIDGTLTGTKLIYGTRFEHSHGKYLSTNQTLPMNLNMTAAYTHKTPAQSGATADVTVTVNGTALATDTISGLFNTTIGSTVNAGTGTRAASDPIINAGGFKYRYVRMYSSLLDGVAVSRNNFADLCYYYGLNIPQSFSDWENSGKIRYTTVYSQFADYEIGHDATEYATQIAEMQEILDKYDAKYNAPAVAGREAEYAKYENLWYDDGHLMSFVDLSKLSEAEVLNVNSPSFDADVDTARLINGGTYNATGNFAKHNFIKIIGGKNKGGYYVLGTNSTDNISVTSDGRVKFLDYTTEAGLVGNVEGIYFGTVFGKEHLGVAFQGVSDISQMEASLQATVKFETFYKPSSTVLYDGSYGNFTIEEVTEINPGKVQPQFDKNIHVVGGLGTNHGNSIGTFRLHQGEATISEFGTADYHNLGNFSSVPGAPWPAQSVAHFIYSTTYLTDSTFQNAIFAISNTNVNSMGKFVKASGGNLSKYNVNPSNANARIYSAGFSQYFVRLYDCTLTESQVMQNHFADICYYYGLKNTETLERFGSVALNDEFYAKFFSFDIGKVTEKDLVKLQGYIDDKIAEFASISDEQKEAYKASLEAAYRQIETSAVESATALAKINEVIATINGNADDIAAVLASKTGAGEDVKILTEQLAKLRALINTANSNKDDVSAYKEAVDALKEASEVAYSAAINATEAIDILSGKNVVDKNLPLARDNATKAVYAAQVAAVIRANAQDIVNYANSADAIASFNIGDYMSFAGFQQRIDGYAAMRAVFNVNPTAMKNGYTYSNGSKTQNYSVVTFGFIFAPAAGATNGFDDITVEKINGKYTVLVNGKSVSGSKIINSPDRRYLVDETTKGKATTDSSIDVYGFENSMIDVGYANYKTEFTKPYYYRAFMVLEGENTSFIRYLNAQSSNLGTDAVSLYQLSSYINTNYAGENIVEKHYWIAKVIFYVDNND